MNRTLGCRDPAPARAAFGKYEAAVAAIVALRNWRLDNLHLFELIGNSLFGSNVREILIVGFFGPFCQESAMTVQLVLISRINCKICHLAGVGVHVKQLLPIFSIVIDTVFVANAADHTSDEPEAFAPSCEHCFDKDALAIQAFLSAQDYRA
jgi:hypothetical protein